MKKAELIMKEMGNNELRGYTNKIIQCDNGIRKNMNQIALLLAEVNQKKLFELENFKNTAEYANAVFGYSKGNVSKMVRVAERYLIGSSKYNDFNTSQLSELLPLEKEETDLLIENKEVTADMTVKAIREVVNSKKKLEENEETETEESAENEETVTAENGSEVVSSAKPKEDKEEIYRDFLERLIIDIDEQYLTPVSIKEKVKNFLTLTK